MTMDNALNVYAAVFDPNPQPYGVGRMVLDESGTPRDTVYEYLNPAMASLTGQQPADLLGKRIFEIWPEEDTTWLDAFYETASNSHISPLHAAS